MSDSKRSWVWSLRLTCLLPVSIFMVSALQSQDPPPTPPAVSNFKGADGRKPEVPKERLLTNFRHDPPVATELAIKWLEKPDKAGNALVQVEYDATSRKRLGRMVEINMNDGPVKLHDDGTNGDEKANDGVFTGITTVDFKALEDGLRKGAESAKATREVPQFEGRVQSKASKLDSVDLTQFKPNGIIKLKPVFPFQCPTAPPIPTIDPARSLMITHLSVVEDPTRTGDMCSGAGTPMGKWSFGHLMTEMANTPATGISASNFVRFWLDSWTTPQTINTFNVAARTQIQNKIIGPWQTASGGPNVPLDMAKAPFRLLAIVNRVDLRDNFAYGGGGGKAGEARFVFCAVDLTPGANCGKALPFTVIFEYGIKKANCTDLKAWGMQWANLSTIPIGTPAFNNALEAITNQFVAANSDPAKQNGSALNQLRTDEIALTGPWELREWTVSNSLGGLLEPVTVKQTPDNSKKSTTELKDFINQHETAILADTHLVPALFPNLQRFLGGNTLNQGASNPGRDFWTSPGINNPNARHHFSLGTCSGCHGGEAFPNSGVLAPFTAANSFFTHVKPREAGVAATLSGFLTGVTVIDPADGTTSRTFNDLARRKLDLENLLKSCCGSFSARELFFRPLRMTH